MESRNERDKKIKYARFYDEFIEKMEKDSHRYGCNGNPCRGIFNFIQNRNSKEATPSDQVTKNYSEADQKVYARQEEALATYQSYYEMYTKYLDESIKMQINPEEVFEGTLSCLISGATQEDVPTFTQ